jgi:hypothetical protein
VRGRRGNLVPRDQDIFAHGKSYKGLAEHGTRIISPDIGGGFGGKVPGPRAAVAIRTVQPSQDCGHHWAIWFIATDGASGVGRRGV